MSRRATNLIGPVIILAVLLAILDIIWHPLLIIASVALVIAAVLAVITAASGQPRPKLGETVTAAAVGLIMLLGNPAGGGHNTNEQAAAPVAQKPTHSAGERTNSRPRPHSARRRAHSPATALTLAAATKTTGCRVHGLLPDRACTPGAIIATAAVSQICTPGYSARVRDVTSTTRAQVYAAYGIASHAGYEIDHLIPLEAGGSNEVANLWPEQGSTVKDRVENQVHDDVCGGVEPLRKAQREIARDWTAVGARDGITPPRGVPAAPSPTPSTPTPPPPPSASPTPAPAPTPSVGDKNCSDFSTHQEAQDYFDQGGGSSSFDFNGLDGNGDGVACSSLP